jgi:hypothetical protein
MSGVLVTQPDQGWIHTPKKPIASSPSVLDGDWAQGLSPKRLNHTRGDALTAQPSSALSSRHGCRPVACVAFSALYYPFGLAFPSPISMLLQVKHQLISAQIPRPVIGKKEMALRAILLLLF